MTSTTNASATFDALLNADPGLEAALRRATDLTQFVQIVASSAERHGMALDADALQAQLQARIDQIAADSRPNNELSDQELSAATGAGMHLRDDLSRMLALDRQQRSKIASSLI